MIGCFENWPLRTALDLAVGPQGLDPRQALLLGETGVRYITTYFQQSLGLQPPDLSVGSRVAVEPGKNSDEITLVVDGREIVVPRSGTQALLFLARV